MTDYIKQWQAAIGAQADGAFGTDTLRRSLALLPGAIAKPAQVSAPHPMQSGVAAFYGAAGGPDCTAGSVALPFAFPLAWDDSQRVTRFACHKRAAASLTKIFSDAAAHYGEEGFRRLRLDQFGGCYNYRVMRGGTSLSMHSWGIAVDLDPINNQLTWGRDRAAFARPEYEPFWRIVDANGATSLGQAKNYDWMHFQFAGIA
jgi:hypothetical protein